MIRAVTLGLPFFDLALSELQDRVLSFSNTLNREISTRGWPLRTTRFCLPPLPPQFEDEANKIPALIRSVSGLADATGVRWFCLPVNLNDGNPSQARLDNLLAALVREERLFANLMVSGENGISISGARAASEFILAVSRKSRKGYDNFRVGASCDCVANTPFFPFSRHEGAEPAFSLALETTEIALSLAQTNEALEAFRDDFVNQVSDRVSEMDRFGQKLANETGVRYAGLDCSLAPFPDGQTSVGRLLELLGADPFGSQGTVFLTALLSDALRSALAQASAKPAGFNGVMYSVLEDDVLAKATYRRRLDIAALKLFSTVCGCGLDMVPVPGDILVEDIEAAILDVAALSKRLSKPLGVRLLPIPERTLNEMTEFNMEFLCDARVLPMAGSDGTLAFASGTWSYGNSNAG